MDPGLVIVLAIFVPLLLLAFTPRTRWSWVPGTLVMAGACVMFAMIKPVHDDIGGIGALANGVMTLAAIGMFFYGLLLFVVGSLLVRKPERSRPAPLPVATVVSGGDN